MATAWRRLVEQLLHLCWVARKVGVARLDDIEYNYELLLLPVLLPELLLLLLLLL